MSDAPPAPLAPIDPRGLTAEQAADKIGRPLTWFYRNRAKLEADGFPAQHPITRRWDPKAIDDYFDRRRPDCRAAIGDAPRDHHNAEIDWDRIVADRLGHTAH